MEYDGEGGGDSNSGEARGKMRRLEEQQGSLGYPDADPSRALHNTVRVTVADLKSGVGCCTTFQQLGCLLEWFAIRSPSTEMGDYIVEEFSFLWNGKVAKTKLASGNRLFRFVRESFVTWCRSLQIWRWQTYPCSRS